MRAADPLTSAFVVDWVGLVARAVAGLDDSRAPPHALFLMKPVSADTRAHPLATLRRYLRRGAPTVIWALLLTLIVGGLHHHAGAGAHHECAVCSLSSAPATATIASAEPAPTLRYERIAVPVLVAPRAARVAATSSRGPPAL
jgi:hypothetical protein